MYPVKGGEPSGPGAPLPISSHGMFLADKLHTAPMCVPVCVPVCARGCPRALVPAPAPALSLVRVTRRCGSGPRGRVGLGQREPDDLTRRHVQQRERVLQGLRAAPSKPLTPDPSR